MQAAKNENENLSHMLTNGISEKRTMTSSKVIQFSGITNATTLFICFVNIVIKCFVNIRLCFQ